MDLEVVSVVIIVIHMKTSLSPYGGPRRDFRYNSFYTNENPLSPCDGPRRDFRSNSFLYK